MTAIEWADVTWNPVRGCSRVSPGCENCYAETMARRLATMGGKTAAAYMPLVKLDESGHPRARWSGKVVLDPEVLAAPLKWKKPRRVFVNSMSDMFHESLTDEQIAAVFGVMAATPQHTFQVLTKRAARMARWFEWVQSEWQKERCSPSYSPRSTQSDIALAAAIGAGVRGGKSGIRVSLSTPPWPLRNVWIGVSAEDQQRADERHRYLCTVTAAVRFYSVEPLLGPIDRLPLDGIDWVIVGGESGPGARPFRPEWAASISEQCRAAGVAYFFKQAGSRVAPPSVGGPRSHGPIDCKGPTGSMAWQLRLADRKGGDVAELAAALPEFAAAGVFRREWPEVTS